MERESNRNAESPLLVTTTFRVEPELLERFKAQAKKDYRSMSAELRRLMSEHLEREAA